MTRKWMWGAVAALAFVFAPVKASAATIGFYGDTMAPTIVAAGHTPQALANLTPADLVGLSVLWILNTNNGTPDANIMNNLAAINAFVLNGGVLSFDDRNVTQGDDANTYLPGGAGISFTTNFSANIDISTGGTLVTNGPGGVINNATLDGGNFSNHGWASVASLPAGAVVIFNDGDPTHAVDFYYPFGLGHTYYSTIPLDFYVPGGSAFATIYGPNEAAFQASLAQPVPEPATMLLLGSGLLGLARRRRARS